MNAIELKCALLSREESCTRNMSKKWKHRVKLVCWTSPGRASWNLRDKRSSIPNVRLLVLFIDLDPNKPLGISRQMRSVPKNLSSECKQNWVSRHNVTTPWPHRCSAVPAWNSESTALISRSVQSLVSKGSEKKRAKRSKVSSKASTFTWNLGISWNQLEVGISWNQ